MRELTMAVSSSIIIRPTTPPPPRHRRRLPLHELKPFSPKLNEPSPSKTPSSPPSSSSSSPSKPPLLPDILREATPRLGYYAKMATKLAGEGRLDHFLMIAESLIASGVDPNELVSHLNVELISEGFSVAILRNKKLRPVVELMSSLEKLGISPLVLFSGIAKESLIMELCGLVDSGNVIEAINSMEVLAGFGFAVKELVEPFRVVKACVDRRDPDIAIKYACILPHAHIVFCTIILEFGKKKDLLSALTAFEACKEKTKVPNMYACRTIIDVCSLCGEYAKSRHIYEELLAQNFTPNVFVLNSLMNANAHDLSYVLNVFTQIKNLGMTPDVASYNILLKTCCLAGRADLAQSIYVDLQSLESVGELKLDVFTYSTVIKVLADAKMWQVALKIKEDMMSAGVTPNTVTWSALISACAKDGLVEQAIQLFNEMIMAGSEPNTQCCNILLHACVEACQYDRAFRLFRSWKRSNSEDTISVYNGNDDNLLEHRSDVTTGAVSMSCSASSTRKFPFVPTTSTYNTLMKACGGDYYRAKTLMDEMKTSGLSPNHISWSILIDICGDSGNVEGAIQILQTMRECGVEPDVVAYTTAIKVSVESKDLNKAFSLYAEMISSSVQPNMVTYSTLLRARSRYGSLHEVQQCLAIYKDMRDAGYYSNDYYLKELIEEWCEGVLQDNHQAERQKSFISSTTSSKRSQRMLLEKVGAHLQKSKTESLVIDVQGLSKVEARIVVLAALRMIKENYSLGQALEDDIFIILGASEVDMDNSVCGAGVKDAIVKLLKKELRLEVLLATPPVKFDHVKDLKYLDSDTGAKGNFATHRLPVELESARKPMIQERLKVTKRSLYQWLQRRLQS